MAMERRTKFNVFYVLFAVFAMLAVQEGWRRAQTIEVVPYSEFEKYLEEDRISEVTVSDQHITGKLRKPEGSKTVVIANLVPPELADRLSRYDVKYTRVVESTLLRDMLSWVLPALVFFGIWYLLARRMSQGGGLGGGFMSIGKSRAKIYVEAKTGVSFADVAGVDEAKAELQEVVEFLKDPKKYGRLGARVPKGVLLVGPPGTGKTLLARAVAGEAGVAFFSISGSEFVEMFVGVGAARVRDLSEQAKAKAPAIIFIDELDALGRARGAGGFGGHDEKEQTLNQLLVELDGFTQAIEGLIAGLEKKNRVLNPNERRIVAHHEMGHALVAMALPGTDPVHKVSIIPRGVGALGYTIQRPTEDRFLMTRAELENKMAALLGARAPDQIIFGPLQTRATDDPPNV